MWGPEQCRGKDRASVFATYLQVKSLTALVCRVDACRVEPKVEVPSTKPSEVPHVEKAQVSLIRD